MCRFRVVRGFTRLLWGGGMCGGCQVLPRLVIEGAGVVAVSVLTRSALIVAGVVKCFGRVSRGSPVVRGKRGEVGGYFWGFGGAGRYP